MPFARKSLYSRELVFTHLNKLKSPLFAQILSETLFPEPFPGLNFETSKKLFEKEEDNNFVEEILMIQLYSFHLNKIKNSLFVEEKLNKQIDNLNIAVKNIKSLKQVKKAGK